MKIRALAYFVSALAVVAALLLWFDGRSHPASLDERIGQPAIALEAARGVAAIRITPADQEPILLQSREDGAWILPDYHRLPVDFPKLSRFMRNLIEAEIDRLVTRRPDRAERLNLGRHTIELRDAGGRALTAFELGRRSQAGGSYFRFLGEDSVFLLNRSLAPDNQASLWTAKDPLAGLKEAVETVTFFFRDGSSFGAARASTRENYLPRDMEGTGVFSPEPFETDINNLLTIRYNEVRLLDDPEVVEARRYLTSAVLTFFEGGEVRVSYGRRPEETRPATGEDEDSEPETIPAGPAYLFLEFPDDADSPWADPSRELAFKIADFHYNRLPRNTEKWTGAPAE